MFWVLTKKHICGRIKTVKKASKHKGDSMNKANEVNLIVEKLVKILWSEDTHGHGKAAIEELIKVCEIMNGQDDKSPPESTQTL